MRIYKIAKTYRVASDCPPGFCDIEIIFKSDGTAKAEVVGHGPEEGCDKVDHIKMMNGLLNKPVQGYAGAMIEVTATGMNGEGLSVMKKQIQEVAEEETPVSGTKMKTPVQTKKVNTVDAGGMGV